MYVNINRPPTNSFPEKEKEVHPIVQASDNILLSKRKKGQDILSRAVESIMMDTGEWSVVFYK